MEESEGLVHDAFAGCHVTPRSIDSHIARSGALFMTAHTDDEDPPPASLPSVKVSFVDAPFAPDVFADEASGFFVRNGIISITFASARCDHSSSPGPVNRVVIGRLVMPVAGAQDLAVGLYDFLAQRGLAPKITPKTAN